MRPRDNPDQKLVRQRRPRDCGVCALANLRGWTWEYAAQHLFDNWHKRRSFGTYTRQFLPLVDKGSRLIPVKKWGDIPSPSMVRVVAQRPNGKGYYLHFVVWMGGMVWDSELREPLRPLFYHTAQPHVKLRSYLGVKP